MPLAAEDFAYIAKHVTCLPVARKPDTAPP
jgi:hypothetical protein